MIFFVNCILVRIHTITRLNNNLNIVNSVLQLYIYNGLISSEMHSSMFSAPHIAIGKHFCDRNNWQRYECEEDFKNSCAHSMQFSDN